MSWLEMCFGESVSIRAGPSCVRSNGCATGQAHGNHWARAGARRALPEHCTPTTNRKHTPMKAQYRPDRELMWVSRPVYINS
jgi:hypothetical protein